MLTNSPVLTLPQNDCQYILDTDASEHGIGAVFAQIQEGEERVIAYASRLYSAAEKRYCVTRKELLAVVFFLRQFKQYFLGTSFTVRTDHAALQWLCHILEPLGQQGRWLEILEEFNFVVQYRPGRAHANADALSRKPCHQCIICLGMSEEATRTAAVMVGEEPPDDTLGAYQNSEAIKKSQLEDPEIRQVIAFKRDCEDAPSADVVASLSPTVKVYLTHWPLLELKDGLLCRRRPTGDGTTFDLQIVMPDKLWQDFLRLAHSGFGGDILAVGGQQRQCRPKRIG